MKMLGWAEPGQDCNSSIPAADTARLYQYPVTSPANRAGVNLKEMGYVPYCQHFVYLVLSHYNVLPPLTN